MTSSGLPIIAESNFDEIDYPIDTLIASGLSNEVDYNVDTRILNWLSE